MSPHYDRHAVISEPTLGESEPGGRPGGDAMDDAAEALRQAEVESVQANVSAAEPEQPESPRPGNAK